MKIETKIESSERMNNINNYEINAFISIARISNLMGQHIADEQNSQHKTNGHHHLVRISYIQSEQTVTNITLFYK